MIRCILMSERYGFVTIGCCTRLISYYSTLRTSQLRKSRRLIAVPSALMDSVCPLSFRPGPMLICLSVALQLTYPGTKISTLPELFSFLDCADPSHQVQLNIESKVDAQFPNLTRPPEDFVKLQYDLFKKSKYYGKITYQSFDWRTLIQMKACFVK